MTTPRARGDLITVSRYDILGVAYAIMPNVNDWWHLMLVMPPRLFNPVFTEYLRNHTMSCLQQYCAIEQARADVAEPFPHTLQCAEEIQNVLRQHITIEELMNEEES